MNRIILCKAQQRHTGEETVHINMQVEIAFPYNLPSSLRAIRSTLHQLRVQTIAARKLSRMPTRTAIVVVVKIL